MTGIWIKAATERRESEVLTTTPPNHPLSPVKIGANIRWLQADSIICSLLLLCLSNGRLQFFGSPYIYVYERIMRHSLRKAQLLQDDRRFVVVGSWFVAARGFLAPGGIDHFGAFLVLPFEVGALEVGRLKRGWGTSAERCKLPRAVWGDFAAF